jgi:RING-box protein 1
MADMDVDTPAPSKKDGKQRFEVKKVWIIVTCISVLPLIVSQWNAVSLWAWGMLSIPEGDSSA